MAMYADDTTLCQSARDIDQLNIMLNMELELVIQWITDNKLLINAGKTKCMILGSKYFLKPSLTLHLDIEGNVIQQVEEIHLMGVIVDSSLSWNSQINKILQKMGRSMGIIRYCKKFIPKWLTKRLAQSLVLAHLDYASVVWSNTNENNLYKLQVAQNKVARIVLGCPYTTNIITMHNNLAWLTVKYRLKYCLLSFIHNIIETKTPEIIYKKCKFFADQHNYCTRQTTGMRCVLPQVKTNQFQRTVFLSGHGCMEWITRIFAVGK